MKRFMIAANCMVLLSSCSPTAPSCNEESVTNLVMEITTKEVRNQDFNTNMKLGGMITLQSYDELNAQKDAPGVDEKVKEIIRSTDQQIADSKLTLSGIRVNSIKNEIKKCECGGNITNANGSSIPITYSAQNTEDGQVYVEVFGLK